MEQKMKLNQQYMYSLGFHLDLIIEQHCSMCCLNEQGECHLEYAHQDKASKHDAAKRIRENDMLQQIVNKQQSDIYIDVVFQIRDLLCKIRHTGQIVAYFYVPTWS